MKKLLVLIGIIVILLSTTAYAIDNLERKCFIEKYKKNDNIYVLLKRILDNNVNMNDLLSSIEALSKANDHTSVEAMVGLLNFYLGEGPTLVLHQKIVEKGQIAFPLIKTKFFDKVFREEWPNETDEKASIEKRNSDLADLLTHIYFNVAYAIDFSELNQAQITTLRLLNIQIALDSYFSKERRYPRRLSDLRPTDFRIDILTLKDGWNRDFKYFCGGAHYFLQSNGVDGVAGTIDDIGPPKDRNLYSFPTGR